MRHALLMAVFFEASCFALSAAPSTDLSPPNEANRAKLDALHQLTADWIRTERAYKEEEDRAKQQLSNLTHLKEVIKNQRDRWKAEALALEKSATQADEERKTILLEQAEIEKARQKAMGQLKVLESQLRGLKAIAPEPLLKEVAIPLLRLERPFKEEDWLERFQSAMSILQSTHAFHRRYSVVQHDVSVGNDQPRAGTVLYMGLSNAYFLSVDGSSAAWGKPSSDGWEWAYVPESREAIEAAIAMAEGSTLEFSLAKLPVEVK